MIGSNNSFAELLKGSRLMATGLKAYAEEVAKRGLDSEFITKLEKVTNETEIKNSKQEKLKAETKQMTEMLALDKQELRKLLSEAKKVVKMTIPQSLWGQFGIEDKK